MLAYFFFTCQAFFLLQCLGPRVIYFNQLLEANNFIITVKLLVLLLAFCCLYVSVDAFKDARGDARFEYPVFVFLAVYGMFLSISSRDFFIMAIGFELQTLSFFVMAAFYRFSMLGAEGSMKYYILGSFSTVIIFMGVSFIYTFAGTTSFSVLETLMHFKVFKGYGLHGLSLHRHHENMAGIFMGLCFFLVGILFKFGMVPFHFWMPDVYESSPAVVTQFFAIVPKIVLLFILIRVFSFDVDLMFFGYSDIFRFLAIASMAYGAIRGLYTTKLRRLIAYAAIAQAGFTFLIFSLDTYNCVEACVVFLVIYSFILANIFTILALYRKLPAYQELKNMSEFTSFLYTNDLLGMSICASFLSLSGMPPLSGFYSKLLMIDALNSENYYFLAMLSIFLTIITIVFYIRILVVTYYNERHNMVHKAELEIPLSKVSFGEL